MLNTEQLKNEILANIQAKGLNRTQENENFISAIAEAIINHLKQNAIIETKYLQQHNAFRSHFIPPCVNEVVILFRLGAFEFALGSFLPQETPTDPNTETITYKDGTKITYTEGTLKIESLKELKIITQKATIQANQAISNANSVILGGEEDKPNAGIVTGECICAFTGSPHADFSSKVKAIK